MLVLVFALASILNSPNSTRSNDQAIRQVATMPVIQPVTLSVISNPFPIAPQKSVSYSFKIYQHSQNIHLDGTFEASGGGGNDIEVYLLDEDELINWRNGHSTSSFYNSGRVTRGTVHLNLPSTTTAPVNYYMIFNNKFSLLSNKVVQGNITVHYDRSL